MSSNSPRRTHTSHGRSGGVAGVLVAGAAIPLAAAGSASVSRSRIGSVHASTTPALTKLLGGLISHGL